MPVWHPSCWWLTAPWATLPCCGVLSLLLPFSLWCRALPAGAAEAAAAAACSPAQLYPGRKWEAPAPRLTPRWGFPRCRGLSDALQDVQLALLQQGWLGFGAEQPALALEGLKLCLPLRQHRDPSAKGLLSSINLPGCSAVMSLSRVFSIMDGLNWGRGGSWQLLAAAGAAECFGRA